LDGCRIIACENEMADGKEEGEGEKEFHKCKVGRKTGGVIWQTFDPEEGVGWGGEGIVERG